ncbi:TPA: hypothetical protein NGW16_004671 [Vibrio parahaemolyticus]|nr:hypothetical protein [Vibrio parahaemolyticus]
MFAKNELVLTSWGKILASFGKDLCRVFMLRKQSPHLMARILTNLLQKSSRNRLASQK